MPGGDPLTHFIHCGAAENRNPNPLFNTAFYLEQCSDLMTTGMNPLLHYLLVGATQGKDPNPLFDSSYYLEQYPDVAASGINPLVHYLDAGAHENRDPSESFDTSSYVDHHPELLSSGINPLAHYLSCGGSAQVAAQKGLLSAMSSALHKYYMQLRDIEPLLPPRERLSNLLVHKVPSKTLSGAAYFKLASTIDKPFSHLFLLPGAGWGGSELVALNFTNAVKRTLGADSVLVLCLDSKDSSIRQRFPDDVRFCYLDDYETGLTTEDRVAILVRLVLQATPRIVHNFNSRVGWLACRDYHRQLNKHSKLIASLYAYDQAADGAVAGYAIDYFNRCIDNLHRVVADNTSFKNSLVDRFALEPHLESKIVRIYHPISFDITPPKVANKNNHTGGRPGVLWASRLDKEKRPDLLLAISKELPEVDFHVYGCPVLGTFNVDTLQSQPNLILHGPFESFKTLPIENVCVFLYTSERDGMPNVPLEATARGLPVVAPNVGGISEFITPATGWLVSQFDVVHEYVAALREALGSAEERYKRAAAAQTILRKHYTIDAFTRELQSWGDYL